MTKMAYESARQAPRSPHRRRRRRRRRNSHYGVLFALIILIIAVIFFGVKVPDPASVQPKKSPHLVNWSAGEDL